MGHPGSIEYACPGHQIRAVAQSQLMEVTKIADDTFTIEANREEIAVMRLCILEALEALQNEDEFRYRVSQSRNDARSLLDTLSKAVRRTKG